MFSSFLLAYKATHPFIGREVSGDAVGMEQQQGDLDTAPSGNVRRPIVEVAGIGNTMTVCIRKKKLQSLRQEGWEATPGQEGSQHSKQKEEYDQGFVLLCRDKHVPLPTIMHHYALCIMHYYAICITMHYALCITMHYARVRESVCLVLCA